MTPLPEKVREHRRIVIDAVIILMVVVLMVQMWLLTAALEAYLAGHMDAALPGAAVSAALFLLCAGLYRFVAGIDRAA